MLEEKFKIDSKKLKKLINEVASDLELNVDEESKDNFKMTYGGSILSFGNNVDITIKSNGNKGSTLLIESNSKFSAQLIDWGTNKKLEEKILSKIKERAS